MSVSRLSVACKMTGFFFIPGQSMTRRSVTTAINNYYRSIANYHKERTYIVFAHLRSSLRLASLLLHCADCRCHFVNHLPLSQSEPTMSITCAVKDFRFDGWLLLRQEFIEHMYRIIQKI